MSTPIINAPRATEAQAAEWARDKGAPTWWIELIPIFWREMQKRRVDPAFAYAQSSKETGFGSFGRATTREHHNPAGLKIRNPKGPDTNPDDHVRFKDWNEGIGAMADHLALYAGAQPKQWPTETADQRQFASIRGKAKTVEALGGNWAPSPTYGIEIVSMVRQMTVAEPKEPDVSPDVSREPLSADRLVAILKAEGLKPIETDGWRTRERSGSFSPIGVLNHHTASRGGRNAPSLEVVKNGRSDLPGPLCNFLVARDATLYLISDGRANDSGSGSSKVLNDVRQDHAPSGDAGSRGLKDDISGNPFFYDIEVENDGIGEPYSDKVIDTVIRINAALCREYGWTANRCIHHREWTRRKTDMSWRGDLRGLVRKRLEQEDDMTTAELIEALNGLKPGDLREGSVLREIWDAVYERVDGKTIESTDEIRNVVKAEVASATAEILAAIRKSQGPGE